MLELTQKVSARAGLGYDLWLQDPDPSPSLLGWTLWGGGVGESDRNAPEWRVWAWWILAGLGSSYPRGLPAPILPPAQTAVPHLVLESYKPVSWGLGLGRRLRTAKEGPFPPTLHKDTPTGSQQPQAAGLGLGSFSFQGTPGILGPHFSSREL